jgi:hypothetical protein
MRKIYRSVLSNIVFIIYFLDYSIVSMLVHLLADLCICTVLVTDTSTSYTVYGCGNRYDDNDNDECCAFTHEEPW